MNRTVPFGYMVDTFLIPNRPVTKGAIGEIMEAVLLLVPAELIMSYVGLLELCQDINNNRMAGHTANTFIAITAYFVCVAKPNSITNAHASNPRTQSSHNPDTLMA